MSKYWVRAMGNDTVVNHGPYDTQAEAEANKPTDHKPDGARLSTQWISYWVVKDDT